MRNEGHSEGSEASAPVPAGRQVGALRFLGVPACVEQMTRLRHRLASWVRGLGFSPEDVDAVVTASYEALANVAVHAYPDDTGTVDLSAAYRPASSQLQVTITDHGQWQPEHLSKASSAQSNGWGLRLMRQLADTVAVDRSAEGTTVRLNWIRPRTVL